MSYEMIIDVAKNPDDFTIDEIVSALQLASEQYYNNTNNDSEPYLTDAEYDNLENYLKKIDPANKYLIGVGSSVRTDKVLLPYPMGGLDQIYDRDLETWIKKNSLEKEKIVVTEKLDGTSILIVYDSDGDLQRAYSRGDGIYGQDITRHAQQIHKLPKYAKINDLKYDGTLVIRAEVVMKKSIFSECQKLNLIDKKYKNVRNYVAGQMNSDNASISFYENVSIVAYEIISPTFIDKCDQFTLISNMGFERPLWISPTGNDICSYGISEISTPFKTNSVYELDGLVLTINSCKIIQNLQERKGTSINPLHSKKYKFFNEDNIATTEVIKVEWQISKDGYLKPRVWIKPVDLVGVTITKATAFNARYIINNNIGPGTIIRITRSGDVIPFITEIVKSTVSSLPDINDVGLYSWNETQIDLVLIDSKNNSYAQKQRLISFVQNLGIEFLGPESVTKLYDSGITQPEHMILASVDHFKTHIGEANGIKAHNSMTKILANIEPSKLAGAGNFFGRGIGSKKLQKIFEIYEDITLKNVTMNDLLKIDGIDDITANQILSGIEGFNNFLNIIRNHYTLKVQTTNKAGLFAGQIVVFTGFRDKKLQEMIENDGGIVASSISKRTTLVITNDIASSSSKIDKAKSLNISIILLDDFVKNHNS